MMNAASRDGDGVRPDAVETYPAAGSDSAGSDSAGSDSAGSDSAALLVALAHDWCALWQSELAAMAADRETHETWLTLYALWFGATAAAPPPPGGQADADAGRTAPTPRAAAAAAAPDARDEAVAKLDRRIGELEQRLAALEEQSATAVPTPVARAPRRKR